MDEDLNPKMIMVRIERRSLGAAPAFSRRSDGCIGCRESVVAGRFCLEAPRDAAASSATSCRLSGSCRGSSVAFVSDHDPCLSSQGGFSREPGSFSSGRLSPARRPLVPIVRRSTGQTGPVRRGSPRHSRLVEFARRQHLDRGFVAVGVLAKVAGARLSQPGGSPLSSRTDILRVGGLRSRSRSYAGEPFSRRAWTSA